MPPLRVLFLLWFVCVTACVLPAADKELLPVVDAKWRHYRSPHFELYSHEAEYESRALLHDLELLRAVVTDRFKLVERARVDVTVYLFRTVAEFSAYGSETWSKDHQFRGFYLSGPDRAIISMAPAEDREAARAMIFHEYVHHLFRAAEQDPPAWFNEGMAELLAGIKVIGGGTLEIGRPIAGRVLALREDGLLPLETLFAVDQGSPIYRSNTHTGLFYAEAWALLHYWYFGDSGIAPDAVKRFVRVASDREAVAATDLRAFFRTCFGMDYPEMQSRLERYVSGGYYKFGRQPAPTIPVDKTYAARPVPVEEARVRLAELALRVNRSSMAKFVLVDAGAQPGAEPRIFEALGADAMRERDDTLTQERWEQAIAAGSTNPALYRELGLLESRAWFREFDYHFELPAERAARLRERLLRAIQHEPNQTAAYEMLAWVEAFSAQPVFANINLVQRQFPALKNKERTLLALAFVRVRAKQTEDAKRLLDDLDGMHPDDWTANAVEIVRAQLENRLPRPTRKSRAAAAGQADTPAATSGGRRFKVPSVELDPPRKP